jgi:predicted DNA-binding transcriptional regulator YafY
MNRSERFYQIDQLLTANKVMSRDSLMDALEVSWATLKRDLAYLRDRLNAPIIFDREAGGYRFDTPSVGPSYELPGLWFSAQEAHALLTMHQLLSDLEPGLLAPHITPLLSRFEAILGQGKLDFPKIAERIKISPIGKRGKHASAFAVVSQAVMQRRRLRVVHHSREKSESSERELSPQRLVHHKNNWYLESWCHTKEALRRFSVDAFESVELLSTPAQEMAMAELDAVFSSGYGIYGGQSTALAKLRFSAAASRWVAEEDWHPQQVGCLCQDGCYELTIPYGDPTELSMDILRHGHHVEVLAPPELRASIVVEIERMLERYAASSQ